MLTTNGRRLVCLSTSNESVRKLLTELWEAGIESESTTNLTDCFRLIPKARPDFVLLAFDHPEYKKVLGLVRAIKSKMKNITVIPFVEKETPAILNRLAQCEEVYQLWPPLNGRKALQVINKALTEHPERFYKSEDIKKQNDDEAKAKLESVGKAQSDDMDTIGDAIQYSIDQICKVNKAVEEYDTVKDTRHVVAVPVSGQDMSGYLIAAVGESQKNTEVKLDLMKEVLDFSKYWMQTQGIQLEFMNEVKVEVPETDFQSWALYSGAFVKTGYHDNFEMSISLFVQKSPTPHFEKSEDETKAKLWAKDFFAGQKLVTDVYLWMEENKKFQAIAREGTFLLGKQIESVMNSKHPYLYIDQTKSHEFFDHYVQTNVNRMIEDFGFSAMENDLEMQLRSKKDQERMRDEIRSAKGIQDHLFPDPHYRDQNLEVRGYYERASETGGDWWFYNVVKNKAYFWIGDATGHGLPAAIVTSAAKSAAAIVNDLPELPLSQTMSIVNSAVAAAGGGEVLMTFFIACLDLDTGKLAYCNASHDFPMLIPSTTEVVKKKDIVFLDGRTGPRLGEDPSPKYKVFETQLAPGDRLIFFTDGIPELENASGEQWGDRRFLRSMLTAFNANTGVTAPMQMLNKDMEDFRRSTQYADDVTYFFVLFKPDARKVKAA